jgi:hypothetical protein
MKILLLTATAAVIGLSVQSYADVMQLQPLGGAAGGPSFTPIGNMVQVHGSGQPVVASFPCDSANFPCISSNTVDTGLGQFSFSSFETGAGQGTKFTADAAGSFSYTANTNAVTGNHDSDTMQMDVTWTEVDFNPPNPTFATLIGTGVVTSSSGDDIFEAGFPVGSSFDIELIYLTSCARFGLICQPNSSQTTDFEFGSIVPVPGPLIGKGLAALLCATLLGSAKMVLELSG